MTVNETLLRSAPSGLLTVFRIRRLPRSRVIEFPTVIENVPPFVSIDTDAGVYVIAPHVNPGIAAGATSVNVHVFPVGIPGTVAGNPGDTPTVPV